MNRTGDYQLAVFVPIFNEQENILRLEEALDAFCADSLVKPVCVMLFNDGSTDGSAELIAQACARHDNFFRFTFERNSGLSTVFKAAVDICDAPYIAYLDADLQTTPEDFNLLLPYIGQYELVTGLRQKRNDNFVRRISSKIGNGVRRMFTHDGISDTACPLKVLQTAAARRLPLFNGMHRFIPALVMMQGGKVKAVPVRHFPRVAGQAKYGVWNRLLKPLADCFAVRWMRKRYVSYKITDTNL